MKQLIPLVFVVLISACGDSPSPAQLKAESQTDSLVVRVLMDLHLTDAQAFLTARENAEDGNVGIAGLQFSDRSLRDSVLRTHGLNEEGFVLMLEEQLANPERFLAVYNRVLDGASVANN